MKKRLNRRRMVQGTVLAGMGLLICRGGQAGESSPNEKLNVAFIAVPRSSVGEVAQAERGRARTL